MTLGRNLGYAKNVGLSKIVSDCISLSIETK